MGAKRPVLFPWLHWVWHAWHRLGDERPWHGGWRNMLHPGRIPWSAVRAWCDHHGYGEDDEAFLERCFELMDKAFIEEMADRMRQ